MGHTIIHILHNHPIIFFVLGLFGGFLLGMVVGEWQTETRMRLAHLEKLIRGVEPHLTPKKREQEDDDLFEGFGLDDEFTQLAGARDK